MIDFIEILKSFLFGIVEGVTEWLPISSTGHMIILDELVKLDVTDAFREMFLVVIQLGAILAVPILFWDKLTPSKKKTREENRSVGTLWLKVLVASMPAALLGFLLDDLLDEVIFGDTNVRMIVVAAALIVYGVLFIVIEHLNRGKNARVESVYDFTYRDALAIGAYQVLALIPGTSRSGSTILGGMLSGISRSASAEFSFFMAIPVMLGASGLKALKFVLDYVTAADPTAIIPDGAMLAYLLYLFIGMAVGFLVSLFAIKFLMSFVKNHSFASFGVYRIVLGVIVIIYFIVTRFVI